MIYKSKKYLGNTNTLQVHNTSNEQTNCQLDEIMTDHRKWYDSLAEAKRDRDYNNCDYCIGD